VLQPAEREFRLPGRRRVPVWLWAIALVLHVPVVLLLLSQHHVALNPPSDLHRIALRDTVRAFALPHVKLDAPARHVVPPPPTPVAVPLTTPTQLAPPSVVGTVTAAPADTIVKGSSPDLQPHYGGGRLWLQPLTESPRTIAKALTGKTDKQLTDSAVSAMIQTYLDAMAVEQAAHPQTLPSWTTKIGGKTVGLDSKWIYLGPIKIPTMLLALLPVNLQGNMSNYQYNQQLNSMRADLFDAARRSATFDDFKRAVKDLHDQTEQRREFTKNQRTPPDTGHHG
jgi:hypothetical protein